MFMMSINKSILHPLDTNRLYILILEAINSGTNKEDFMTLFEDYAKRYILDDSVMVSCLETIETIFDYNDILQNKKGDEI